MVKINQVDMSQITVPNKQVLYGNLFSYTINGIDAKKITIEADIRYGNLPKFSIVGLPSNTVKESKERVGAAIKNSGFRFALGKHTINLAPADIPKDGVSMDLPIALSILLASGELHSSQTDGIAFIGELSLNGKLRGVKGVLPIVMAAKNDNIKSIYLPEKNAEEAAIVEGIDVFGVSCLNEIVSILKGKKKIEPTKVNLDSVFAKKINYAFDMFDVKGQYQSKRALEVAAAGGHNVIMIGPPGSGKTMLAKRLTSILPQITLQEALQTTKIFSISGKMIGNKNGIVSKRPFRSPHHTISDIALIGGGSYPKPGEVSLAHNGVLFLDELTEFQKTVLEVLRQPLEDGVVTISRANASLCFPADFMLIASMNPCPCGYFGSPTESHSCNCNIYSIQRYRAKISGPLLDRFDIHIEVPSVKYDELSKIPSGEKSVAIQKRVNICRKVQSNRFKDIGIFSNSQMNPKHIRKYCVLNKQGNELLKNAIEKMGLSARAYDKILKVSRTIADLENSLEIKVEHIAEAVQYRSLDRKYWE